MKHIVTPLSSNFFERAWFIEKTIDVGQNRINCNYLKLNGIIFFLRHVVFLGKTIAFSLAGCFDPVFKKGVKMSLYAIDSQSVASVKRSCRGMSLIELVVAMGIFSVVVLMALLAQAGSVQRNRSTRLTVAATAAARQTVEDTIAMANSAVTVASAAEDAAESINRPRELCRYFLSGKLPVDFKVTRYGNPLTRIECRFPAVLPGENARDASGVKQFLRTAENGYMASQDFSAAEALVTIYLDESQVPVEFGGQIAPLWRDLSLSSSVTGPLGFDINGDGKISSGGLIRDNRNADFISDPSISYQFRRLAQLPIDITLTYYYHEPKTRVGVEGDARSRQTHIYRLLVTDSAAFGD